MLKLCLLGITLVCLSTCNSQEPMDTKETRFLLGTIVEFTVFHSNEDLALRAIGEAAQEMQAVEKMFTIHGDITNSVQAFNLANINQKILLDLDVEQLLLQSIALHRQTEGAFDPTLGDLNQKWGFSGEHKPTQPLDLDTVRDALEKSGVAFIKGDENHVWLKKKEGLKLDFGAIAKGLAIDRGIASLEREGIKHAIINAGGDMRILGDHGGKPWKVGIRHPRLAKPLGWFPVSDDISIVTSGDYERYFMHEGARYHHIIDPSTGLPSSKSMSVTVIAPSATVADALSTAMFILGYKKGLSLIENFEGVEALWVDAKQQVHLSSGMHYWLNKDSIMSLKQ